MGNVNNWLLVIGSVLLCLAALFVVVYITERNKFIKMGEMDPDLVQPLQEQLKRITAATNGIAHPKIAVGEFNEKDFQIVIKNVGEATAKNIRVTNDINSGFVFLKDHVESLPVQQEISYRAWRVSWNEKTGKNSFKLFLNFQDELGNDYRCTIQKDENGQPVSETDLVTKKA